MASESCADYNISGILPWYVNGTLSNEERQSVEHHLARCAVCREETALLQQIADALHAVSPTPSNDLYARTVARVQPQGWRRFVPSLRQLVIPVPVYARVALVAQLVVIVALAAVLVPRDVLPTLSEGPRHPSPGVQVQVIFSTGATAGEIQTVLTSLKARVVDGPTPLGVYSVVIPVGSGASVSTTDDALRKLRASPLIKFADVLEERR